MSSGCCGCDVAELNQVLHTVHCQPIPYSAELVPTCNSPLFKQTFTRFSDDVGAKDTQTGGGAMNGVHKSVCVAH